METLNEDLSMTVKSLQIELQSLKQAQVRSQEEIKVLNQYIKQKDIDYLIFLQKMQRFFRTNMETLQQEQKNRYANPGVYGI